MADTHAKVANSFEDEEESYHDDDLAGGDTEEGKNSEGGRKDGRRGGRRFNNRRRRRRASNDEPTGPVEPIVLGVEVTKWSIRKKVWDSMEDHNLVNFPRPCHHRIPNFKGAAIAADKLPTLDEFKRASIIKVNPDKPQEQARFLTLEAEKTLLVPTPRLRSGLFNRITPPEDPNKEVLRICSTSQGVREYSTPIGLEDKVKIDLVITGSVAVSKKGYRLGKGEGFADLEWAMMFTMGAVNENTIVVSTVHDHQIIDIPDQLIEEHDLTVDYIITPTEIIKTDCKRSKAKGIIWSKLDKERLKRIPVLKKLRKMERAAGVDVRLRGQDEDNEEDDKTDEEEEVTMNGDDQRQRRRRPRFQNYNRRIRRPRRRSQQGDDDGAGNSDSAGEHHEDGDMDENDEARNRKRRERRPRQSRRPRGGRSHDPSIYVGGLPRSLRVSEFKEKIHDRSVQPLRVVWHGGSGHAFLQFQDADVAEDAIEALKDLDINGRQLKVELARSNRGDKSGQDDDEGEGGHDVGNDGD